MKLNFEGIPSDEARALWAGGPDAYGRAPEHLVAEGGGYPCRHCLGNVPDGAGVLLFAYRPFPSAQPYAETGPVFLCAAECAAPSGGSVPPVLRTSPDYLLKGYTDDHRIRYGTGRVVPGAELTDYATTLLADPDIAFVDVRSARNNCFLVRIRRA